jgi:adenosylhomocysteine nucleosidase
MRILFVGADAMELAGLWRRCRQARACHLPVDWARTARLGQHEIILAANGAGAARAAAAVEAAAAGFAPDALVSLGFCGALAPRLNVADIVVAAALWIGPPPPLPSPWPPSMVASDHPHHSGPICSLDHVAQTAAEKHQLGSAGAIAVEMEAAGVAARAEALGLPFYCIKAVTDLAGEDLSIDFNSLLRSDGHFDKIEILKSALRHPSLRLPELLRLRRRCLRAREVLGEFIAGCRF